jgi:hypothetical protein
VHAGSPAGDGERVAVWFAFLPAPCVPRLSVRDATGRLAGAGRPAAPLRSANVMMRSNPKHPRSAHRAPATAGSFSPSDGERAAGSKLCRHAEQSTTMLCYRGVCLGRTHKTQRCACMLLARHHGERLQVAGGRSLVKRRARQSWSHDRRRAAGAGTPTDALRGTLKSRPPPVGHVDTCAID